MTSSQYPNPSARSSSSALGEVQTKLAEAIANGQQGGPGLLVVSDMDGSITWDATGEYPFVHGSMDSRIHPLVAGGYASLNGLRHSRVVISTGGGADRTAHVFRESRLAGGVQAYCNYGAERVARANDGSLVEMPHVWSAALEPLWNEIQDALAGQLGVQYTEDGSKLDVGFRVENKGTTVALHARTRSREEIAAAVKATDLSGLVNKWVGRSGPDMPTGLREALGKGIAVDPTHNAVVELAVPLGVNKGTVLNDALRDYLQENGFPDEHPPTIAVVVDDVGDIPMLEAADELRDSGVEVVRIVIDNPAHPTEAKWSGTLGAIQDYGDVILSGVANERGDHQPPQRILADLVHNAITLAFQMTAAQKTERGPEPSLD